MRLFNFIFLLIGAIFCSGTIASDKEPAEVVPLNPQYKAEHAMVLMNQGSRVYAANIPNYELPFNMQVVYKVDVSDLPFLDLVRDAELVTIKPQPFNIQRLMRGEKVMITADVYIGDYMKDGLLAYSNKSIELTERLYSREFDELSEASKWQQYDMITLDKNERIFIHQITQAPSFHHILFVNLNGACLQKFRTSTEIPSVGELNYKFINCGKLKPLYYDAEKLK